MTLPGISGGKLALYGFLASLLMSGLAGTAGYLKGRSDGYAVRVAADEGGQKAVLKAYAKAAEKTLSDLAAQNARDFEARMAALDAVANQLQHMQGIANANAQALAASLRGRFVLSPLERLRFECIRRPSDTRCATNGLPASLSSKGR